jgi:hypothetical protein
MRLSFHVILITRKPWQCDRLASLLEPSRQRNNAVVSRTADQNEAGRERKNEEEEGNKKD